MEWLNTIVGILSGTSLVGIVGSIVFFRETRRLKRNEVKASTVEVQRQEIDLADMYKDKMLNLLEQVGTKQDTSTANQELMLKKMDKLDGRVDTVENKLSSIVTYLNGEYQAFLKRQPQ